MKKINFLIFLLLSCIFLSHASGDNDFGTISQTIAIPPTGTALLGTNESMTQYGNWLDECSAAISDYATRLLNFLGFNGLFPPQQIPAPETPAAVPISNKEPITDQPTLSIPEIPQRITVLKVTGSDGAVTSDSFAVDDPYWELWYTADPLTTGGQDTSSATGSYSAVFPVLTIQVIDKENGTVIETVEPPGGLDKNLWERSGVDPRPWIEKYYYGYSQYYLRINAEHLQSYIVEARVPSQPEQYGPAGVRAPLSNETQKQYVVACRVFRAGNTVNVILDGGRDASDLRYISLTENGEALGNYGTPGGQTPLPIGIEETFPVSDQDPVWYVIGTGHFVNGDEQKIFETTLEPTQL